MRRRVQTQPLVKIQSKKIQIRNSQTEESSHTINPEIQEFQYCLKKICVNKKSIFRLIDQTRPSNFGIQTTRKSNSFLLNYRKRHIVLRNKGQKRKSDQLNKSVELPSLNKKTEGIKGKKIPIKLSDKGHLNLSQNLQEKKRYDWLIIKRNFKMIKV